MCEARQYSDQKVCTRCNLTWDMNDPEPPICLTAYEVGKRWIAKILEVLDGCG